MTGELAGWIVVAAALAPLAAGATEGGGSSKVVGVDTVLAGLMPPPGLQLTVFIARYEAERTNDSRGDPRSGIRNFDLGVEAITARLQYVWKDARLWGADIETRVGYTLYVRGRVSLDVATLAGTLHRSGSSDGTGDALLAPVLLGWHSDTFHQTAGVQFYLPAGRFDPSRLANNSRGYYSASPLYAFTWFPASGVEVSGSLSYLFNFENRKTNYRSGREVSFDYGLGYAVLPGVQAGVSGYLYKQVSDDKVAGAVAGDGNRGQVVAIGPFLRYHPRRDWAVTFKWQREAQARNKTEGDRFFLQLFRRF